MDVLVTDRSSSYWGKIDKITDGWGGTIFVRTNPNTSYKFDKNGSLRTQDPWNHRHMHLCTPEQKSAILAHAAANKERLQKANALKMVQWEHQDADKITQIHNLAVALGLIVIVKKDEIVVDSSH
jgi:hypothetical protein